MDPRRTDPRRETVIVPYRNGPLIVRGPVRLEDQNGNPIDAGRSPMALCRCGRSRVRPFCDGSHATTRFSAPSGREDRVRERPSGAVPESLASSPSEAASRQAGGTRELRTDG